MPLALVGAAGGAVSCQRWFVRRGDPDLSDRMALSPPAGPRRLDRSRVRPPDALTPDLRPRPLVDPLADPLVDDAFVNDPGPTDSPPGELAAETASISDPHGPHGRGGPKTPDQARDQLIDVRLIGQRLRRLSRLDPSVFREVRDDSSQTLSAILVVLGAVLLSALGGWLWLIAEAEGLSTGRILVRQVVLGTIFGLGVWALWVFGAHVMLRSVFGRPASGTRLLRTMGYAAFPVAGSVLMVVPALGFAVGLMTVMAWFAASNAAIEAAAPEATRKEVLVANLAGFSLLVVVMSVLADAAGVAPGFFVRAADLSVYV